MSHRSRVRSKLLAGPSNMPARPLTPFLFDFPVLLLGKDWEEMDEYGMYDELMGLMGGNDPLEPEELWREREDFDPDFDEPEIPIGVQMVYMLAATLRKHYSYSYSQALSAASYAYARGELDPYDFGFDC